MGRGSMPRAHPKAPIANGRPEPVLRAERLEIRRVPSRALTGEEREAMWRCYRRFVDARRDAFMHTIDAADEAFLFYDRESRVLVGFEVFCVLTVPVDGHPYTVVYSCYADLEPAVRGLNLLQRVALRKTLRVKLRHPFRSILWMFTASTYLSYLLMPNNLVEYWPRPERPTPPHLRRVMDAVMRALDKEGWDRETGVVRRHGALRYREGLVGSDPALLTNPHIRFYAALNPGQPDGDSLACLCPVSLRNVSALLAAMARRAWTRVRSPRAAAERVAGDPPGSAPAPG